MSTSHPSFHFTVSHRATGTAASHQDVPVILLPHKETSMTNFAPAYTSDRMQSREKQKRMCQRLVQLTCVFFVPFVLLRRLTATAAEKGANQLSVLAEARADASAIIPFIFMG